MLSRITNFLHRAFIAPWGDKGRASVMLVGFIGNATFGMISFMLNYSMAQEGFGHSITYQLVRMPIMGLVMVPLTFWVLAQWKSRLVLALLQLFGASLFFIDITSGLVNAAAFPILATSYWSLYNLKLATHQSRENRGNETALSWFLVVASYSLGLLTGGWFLENGHMMEALLVGSLLIVLATQMLVIPIRKGEHTKSALKLIGFKKPTSRLTVLANLQSIIMEGCMPIWMSAIGVSPLAAGINLAIRPFLGAMLTPAVGYLVQKGGLKSSQIGGAFIFLGWSLIAGTLQIPSLLAPAMTFLSMGSNFIVPGELARWYKKRSPSAIIAREYLLMAGRMPAFAMALPIIFFAPVAYPAFGLAVGVLFALGTRPLRRGLSWKPSPVKGSFIKEA